MSITLILPSGERKTSTADTITIGSAQSCQICLADRRVRPKHATIRKVAGKWLIEAEDDGVLKVNDGVAARKCWLSEGCEVHLTENGPSVVFSMSASAVADAIQPSLASLPSPPPRASKTAVEHSSSQMPSSPPVPTTTRTPTAMSRPLWIAGAGIGWICSMCVMCGLVGMVLGPPPKKHEEQVAVKDAATSGNVVPTPPAMPNTKQKNGNNVMTGSGSTIPSKSDNSRSGNKKAESRWGFIDKKGTLQVALQFEDVGDFAHGLAKAQVNGKWGYINKSGEFVIPPRYDEAATYSEDVTHVNEASHKGSICLDANGKELFRTRYQLSEHTLIPNQRDYTFDQGVARISNNLGNGVFRYGLISKSGTVIVEPSSIPMMFSISHGRVIAYDNVRDGHPSAMLDLMGNEVVPWSSKLSFASVGSRFQFSEGLIVYGQDMTINTPRGPNKFHTFGYMDRDGKIIISHNVRRGGGRSRQFREGLAAVIKDDAASFAIHGEQGGVLPSKFGFIDVRGDIVIFNQFYAACDFSEGLAAVQMELDGKWGFIDKKGRMVIPLQFSDCGFFTEGLATATIGNKSGYINHEGTFVIAPVFDDVRPFFEGMAAVKVQVGTVP